MSGPAEPVLSAAAFRVMAILVAGAEASAPDLEDRLHERHVALGDVLQELVDAGYAERCPDAVTDAPAARHRATPEGRAAFADHTAWLEDRLSDRE
jgi:DNA-binding MarR family transcriptional regulator